MQDRDDEEEGVAAGGYPAAAEADDAGGVDTEQDANMGLEQQFHDELIEMATRML